MDPEPLNGRPELREAIEPRLARAPVVFLQPVFGDLLRVCERQPLRPVVDALALGPSRLAKAPLEIVELRIGRRYPEGFDIVAHCISLCRTTFPSQARDSLPSAKNLGVLS